MKRVIVVMSIIFQLAMAAVGNAQIERESQAGLSFILSLGGVQKELELTDAQAYDVDDLWLEIQDDLQMAFGRFAREARSSLTVDERELIEAELMSSIKNVREHELERLNDTLLPNQIKRLAELRVQFLKRNASGLEMIAVDLRLTRTQKKKIQQLGRAIKTQVRELTLELRNGTVSQLEMAREVTELRQDNKKNLLKILTSSQKRKLKELEGKSFEFQTSLDNRKE